jgi:hypothetical protein
MVKDSAASNPNGPNHRFHCLDTNSPTASCLEIKKLRLPICNADSEGNMIVGMLDLTVTYKLAFKLND